MLLNYKRKSTIGWSVANAMTDMSGGLFSLAQQILDAFALKVSAAFGISLQECC